MGPEATRGPHAGRRVVLKAALALPALFVYVYGTFFLAVRGWNWIGALFDIFLFVVNGATALFVIGTGASGFFGFSLARRGRRIEALVLGFAVNAFTLVLSFLAWVGSLHEILQREVLDLPEAILFALWWGIFGLAFGASAPVLAERAYSRIERTKPGWFGQPTRKDSPAEGLDFARVTSPLPKLLLALVFAYMFLPFLRVVLNFLLQGPAALSPENATPFRLRPVDVWIDIGLRALAYGLLPVLYLRLKQPGESIIVRLGLRAAWRDWSKLAVGLALGAMVALAIWFLSRNEALPVAGPSYADALVDLVRLHPEFLLVIPLVAALFEELAFRGFLQSLVGLLPATLLFAAAHATLGSLSATAVVAVGGLGFGLLYHWTRVLWVPVAAHFAYDFVLLLLVLQ